jgi:hypothetical protein
MQFALSLFRLREFDDKMTREYTGVGGSKLK